MPSAPPTAPSGVRAVVITAFAIVLALAGLVALHAANPRLLPSWHGFLHGAIALRFPVSGVPPENPFFAGELLPYYWFYHLVGHLAQRVLHTDPVHAFQAIAFASLALLIGAGAAIGHRRFGSLPAGLAIALLAVVGGNPLGFVMAAAKHATGHPLLDSPPAVVDEVFVDNLLADRLMTHPVLPALNFTGDWRAGQNFPWFFDISSRTPALALAVLVLFLWLGRARPPILLGIAIVGGITTALNPLIGLALMASLSAAELPWAFGALRREGRGAGMRALAKPLAAFAGVLLALPTFYHMLLLEGTSELSDPRAIALKIVIAGAVFLMLAPLAILGLRGAPAPLRGSLRSVTLAGGILIAVMVGVHLEEGNEHNISNLAQCVLAVPAAAALAWSFRPDSRGGWLGLAALALVCAPTAAATVAAFSGRPAPPLAFEDGQFERIPADGSLQRGYDWIRTSTPPDAILVSDPRRPIKMGGNVSEIPAFTGRALLVDQPSYLVTPHKDAALRTALATALMDGHPLRAADSAYLAGLGRSLYLVAYDVDAAVSRRLDAIWGTPRFSAPPLTVYALDPYPAQPPGGAARATRRQD